MAITSKLQRLASMVGTGSAAAFYTCPTSSRVLSPILYVMADAASDPLVSIAKTNAAIGTAYTTIHWVIRRALAANEDQQIELAGLEAGDILSLTALATTNVELWGVLDA